jgi:ABC-type molybdate transport system substrate-binding protein
MRFSKATGETRRARLRVCPPSIVAGVLMTATASLASELVLYAPGSLRGALREAVSAFEAETGIEVAVRYGPSGMLREAIEEGAPAHVFTSGTMENPRALTRAGKSGPVTLFARNRICALVRDDFAVGPANLLERMLADDVKLGTAVPENDPAGQYAFDVFRKADAIKPGARAALEGKALRLVSTTKSCYPLDRPNIYGKLLAEGQADIFLTLCTNVLAAVRENPSQRLVSLPDSLAVSADYGVTVLTGAPASAHRFVDYVMSPNGQHALVRYGFTPAGEAR